MAIVQASFITSTYNNDDKFIYIYGLLIQSVISTCKSNITRHLVTSYKKITKRLYSTVKVLEKNSFNRLFYPNSVQILRNVERLSIKKENKNSLADMLIGTVYI